MINHLRESSKNSHTGQYFLGAIVVSSLCVSLSLPLSSSLPPFIPPSLNLFLSSPFLLLSFPPLPNYSQIEQNIGNLDLSIWQFNDNNQECNWFSDVFLHLQEREARFFLFSLVIIYKLLNSSIYRYIHKDYIEKILFLKLKTLETHGSIVDSIIHLIIQYLHQ